MTFSSNHVVENAERQIEVFFYKDNITTFEEKHVVENAKRQSEVSFNKDNITTFEEKHVVENVERQIELSFNKDNITEFEEKHVVKNAERQIEVSYKDNITTFEEKPKQAQKQPPRKHPSCPDPFLEEFQEQKRFVCCYVSGGTGNLMFSFASAYGMASKGNKTVVLGKSNQLLNLFDVNAMVVANFCVCNFAKSISESKHCAFDEKLLRLTEPVNYFPKFYFQSWKYFYQVADDIRKQFKFKDHIQNAALDILKNITTTSSASPVITVGVHIRRGDIIKQPNFISYGYMVAPAEYFTKAMVFFRDKYRSVVFVVCSNDMKWTKANINGSDVIYVEGQKAEVDLAVLSNCQHSIMSVGTFGWWSAFLAGGQVVHYKHPARNNTPLRRQFSDDFSDFFYPGWIGME